MITDPRDFFVKGCGRCARFDTPACSALIWLSGLTTLRALCLSAGLDETAKWGHPCYVFEGRNIAIIGAFQGDFRLTFFGAALMTDPDGVLEKAGPNTQNAGVMRFADVDDVESKAGLIARYLDEAIGYAKAGIKPPRQQAAFEVPEELVEALDADPELAEAFYALTPGRQWSYVIHINGAKAIATKKARIERSVHKIMAGKGQQER